MALKRLYTEYRGLQVPMALEHGPVTSSGKSAPGPDPRIRHRIQIGMFRSIRVDHTNCLQVAIKTHSFILLRSTIRDSLLLSTRHKKCLGETSPKYGVPDSCHSIYFSFLTMYLELISPLLSDPPFPWSKSFVVFPIFDCSKHKIRPIFVPVLGFSV